MINMAMWKPIESRAMPTSMIAQPITTPMRLPRISAQYGTIGMASIEPMAIEAVNRPMMEGLGWWK